ncbi:AMP-binding protein [Lysobacter fragariae]
MLYHWERTRPDAVYLRQPVNRVWRDYTWREVGEQARRVAAALKARGYPPGSNIAIWSKNCAEWVVTDLGIMMAGHVSVPLYATQSTASARYVLELTEAKLIFLGKFDDAARVPAALPDSIETVAFPYPTAPAQTRWQDFIDIAPDRSDRRPDLDETFTIVFTSGTTGQPKGVVQHYRAAAVMGTEIARAEGARPGDSWLSHLPLAHVAERVMGEMVSLYSGMAMAFNERVETFAEDLRTVRPTIFGTVPRLWVVMQQGIEAKVPSAKLQRLLRLPLVGTLVRRKIRKQLGMDRVRFTGIGSAAAPLPAMHFWASLGMQHADVYAMSESFGHGTIQLDGKKGFGTVGKPLPTAQVCIGEGGEILLAGPALFKGYYKNPEATAEVLRDGWLHTGDVGEFDANGRLKVTGRTKEIFKTAKGEYIAPYPLEAELTRSGLLGQVCVMGAGMKQPVALATLTPAAKAQPRADVERDLQAFLAALNPTLPTHERIDRVVVVDQDWTPDNELLTPTLKLRRNLIEKHYAPLVEANAQAGAVVWERK